ncbi:hypothetical protein HO133_010708 [Letharia lupina]|uniref:SPX domain-containing protein n=1 Tax=Letharia lupina TaxID=560253 RepID=A0A8H6FDR7_9LECA|nr:uncharacterized protein HO133_010708 [Letharia lupina]KAF6224134.1 hypothetical protein HO133_010708 [Letharia lupina]
MKYGETFQQRSIPLWENYNVDYNDIKHLIKVRTTQGQGQAKAIPGSDSETKAFHAFEDELYRELRDQHQRIDLFVQSKAGEVGRKLAHLDKQIAQLEIRSFPTSRGKLPIKRLEKFSRLEEAVLKAGEEIQSLSRFVGAQRLAFQKLLKKYRKWTGSSELGNRFRKEVLDRRTSFSKTDFEPLLAQWTQVLASVRAPFVDGISWQSDPTEPKKEEFQSHRPVPHKSPSNSAQNQAAKSQHVSKDLSSAADLQTAWENGSNLEIDTALATIPFGHRAAKAAYWIHPDNIVQIHVLLLQYTRLQKSNETFSSPESPSSPRGSISGHPARGSSRTDEELGVIICDDLQRFAQRQSSETISDSENRAGFAPEKAAASIRYSSNGDAVVVVGAGTNDASKSTCSNREFATRKARFKRKAIQRLFSTSSGEEGTIADGSKDSEQVSEWFVGHNEVQPLVQLRLRRTRFVGLKNSATNGLWATLDKNISMWSCPPDLLASDKGFNTIDDGGEKDSEIFPHAVLEIRTEGPADTNVIAALDASYLTERVRGFSLETHAVATLCKPQGMPRPFWLPALKQDIRKVPATSKLPKARKSQGRSSPEESSTRHTSVSASSTKNGISSGGFSALRGESSATSAPDTLATPPLDASKKIKRRRSNRKQMPQKRLREPAQPRYERYWNEFDDGSDGSQDGAYTIFVDPNASYSIPGAAAVFRLCGSISSSIKASEETILHWFRSFQKTRHGEQRLLVNGECSPSTADSDQSDADSSTRHVKSSPHRRYSTFPVLSQPPAARAREALLFRSCIASFASSIILLVVAACLVTTGRRKAANTVDAGVIIGVVSSLVFAVMGAGSMVRRKDDVGWMHRAAVFLVFVCVVLASSILLAALRLS